MFNYYDSSYHITEELKAYDFIRAYNDDPRYIVDLIIISVDDDYYYCTNGDEFIQVLRRRHINPLGFGGYTQKLKTFKLPANHPRAVEIQKKLIEKISKNL